MSNTSSEWTTDFELSSESDDSQEGRVWKIKFDFELNANKEREKIRQNAANNDTEAEKESDFLEVGASRATGQSRAERKRFRFIETFEKIEMLKEIENQERCLIIITLMY